MGGRNLTSHVSFNISLCEHKVKLKMGMDAVFVRRDMNTQGFFSLIHNLVISL